MPDQPPTGETPNDNPTSEQSPTSPRLNLDDLLAAMDEDSRKALRDHLSARNDQIARYRRRLSEVEPKAAKYDKAEEAAKSEAQKAAEAMARAERERDEAKAHLLRYEVIAAYPGLQAGDAEFLTGTTREELEASAAKLLTRFQASTPTPVPGQHPAPDPGQGRNGQGAPVDPEAWLRGALKRH